MASTRVGHGRGVGATAALAALFGIALTVLAALMLWGQLASGEISVATQTAAAGASTTHDGSCYPRGVAAQVSAAAAETGQPRLGQVLIAALRCFPSSGAWWTQLAWYSVHRGNLAGFDRFFAIAEETAPAEGALMRIRLDLLAATRDDQAWAEPAVQERYRTYFTGANRRQITDLLDATAESRRPQLVALIRSVDTYEIEQWLRSADAKRFGAVK